MPVLDESAEVVYHRPQRRTKTGMENDESLVVKGFELVMMDSLACTCQNCPASRRTFISATRALAVS